MSSGWTRTTLGGVAAVNPKMGSLSEDAPFVPMDAVHAGKRFVAYYESRGERSGARAFGGDVLFARITPCLENGKVAQLPYGAGPCGGSTEFIVIRGSELISSDFIYFWASSEETRNTAAGLMTGTTGRQRLSWQDLSSIELDLPPIEEQRRIVDLVSSVDTYIDALQQQAVMAREARKAVLHELLSTGGDDWTETTLGELCEIYQPETISKAKMDDSAPYVVYGANGPVGRYSRFNHEEPEVVVTCRGATCGVVNMTPSNCWITGNAMVVKPKDKRSTKWFLYWALQTTVDVHAAISGSAQPQITRTSLAPSKIKVPPLVEQKRIVEIVSSMDALIQSADNAVANAKNLRSGLLSELLSGAHEIPEAYDRLLGAA